MSNVSAMHLRLRRRHAGRDKYEDRLDLSFDLFGIGLVLMQEGRESCGGALKDFGLSRHGVCLRLIFREVNYFLDRVTVQYHYSISTNRRISTVTVCILIHRY
jgi:hypothetical protein